MMDRRVSALEDRVESIDRRTKNIEKSDIEQKSSLKSIHLRLSEDAKVRQETHDEVMKQTIALRTHMEWEEKEHALKKEAEAEAEREAEKLQIARDKKDSIRFTIITSILSVVAVIFIAVSSWLFLTVISNDKEIGKHSEKINYNKNQVTYLKGRIK